MLIYHQKVFCGIHLTAMLSNLIGNMLIDYILKPLPHLPGTNELIYVSLL